MKLLDSNVFILGIDRPDQNPDREAFYHPYAYSIVSRIEVLGFPRLTAIDQSDLLDLLAGGKELPLTDTIASRATRFRQVRRMSLGDAIIAATAVEHGLPLVTHDRRGFLQLPELTFELRRMVEPPIS